MAISLERGTEAGQPVYQQIAAQLRAEIQAGRLGPGDRLPTLRDLARTLRVNRDTVALAYEELTREGLIEATAVGQLDVFSAALQFARTEGILPAPESSHAIRAAINEAVDAKEKGEEKVILFNLSGNGFLDLSAYDQYLHGSMIDGSLVQAKLEGLSERLPVVG